MSFKVHIVKADRTIEVPTGATILWSALEQGVDYPFGCQSGNCGACKSHLVKGEVTMEGYSEFALSDEEKARGLILACRAVPLADCEVAWLEEDDLIVHPRRILACTVVGLDGDWRRLRLCRPNVDSTPSLGVECIERGVYEVWVSVHDIDDLHDVDLTYKL